MQRGGGPMDRKRISETLDRRLERTSVSTSKIVNERERDRKSMLSGSIGKNTRDKRGLSKNKCSADGWFFSLFFPFLIFRKYAYIHLFLFT